MVFDIFEAPPPQRVFRDTGRKVRVKLSTLELLPAKRSDETQAGLHEPGGSYYQD